MRYFVILILLTLSAYALSPEDEAKVKVFQDKFEKEWEKLAPLYKANINVAFQRGKEYGLAYTAAGATLIETRGVPDRVGVNGKNKYIPHTFDCGIMGSNTYWFLRYRGIKKPTYIQQIEACKKLNDDSMLSFEHFLNVIFDATSRSAIEEAKGTKMYWRLIWNYYNTGKVVLKGKYYLKMIAAIRFLKTVIRTDTVGYVVDVTKIKNKIKRVEF